MTSKIIIKISDAYFLQQTTFNLHSAKIILGNSTKFFSTISKINALYAGSMNQVGSESIFNGLIATLNGLPNTHTLESLYSLIDATFAVDLMEKAKNRTGFIGDNLLNYYYIDVDSQSITTVIDILKIVPGVAFVTVRGNLANLDAPSVPFDLIDKFEEIKGIESKEKTIPIENLQMKKLSPTTPIKIKNKIASLFANSGLNINSSVNSNIKIVDFEQSWYFDSTILRPGSSLSKTTPIFGGGLNKQLPSPVQLPHRGTAPELHGRKTLNILFGKTTNTNRINGLCKGATPKIASTWFNDNPLRGEQREAALIKTLVNSGISAGDIVLLELQVSRWNYDRLPVEIESAMYAVIKVGVQAGYIIIEAAGNGGHNLDDTQFYRLLEDPINPPNNPRVNLNNNSTGAIMVGAVDKYFGKILNRGNRIDYDCFGEPAITSSGISFNATSLASAITTALVAHFQSQALKPSPQGIGRRLTITEIKLLLKALPINFNTFLNTVITQPPSISQP